MSFESLTNKQLRERMRFLSDKSESIWEKLVPLLNEFNECKTEFDEILKELLDRGVVDENFIKTESGENTR